MKKKKPPTLKSLQKIWDQKLKNSGFIDIEDRKTGMLKTWSGSTAIPKGENYSADTEFNGVAYGYSSCVKKKSQAEYYRIASSMVHSYDFPSVRHRIVWMLHSEGLSYSKIAQEMKLTVEDVRYKIEALAKKFELKPLK